MKGKWFKAGILTFAMMGALLGVQGCRLPEPIAVQGCRPLGLITMQGCRLLGPITVQAAETAEKVNEIARFTGDFDAAGEKTKIWAAGFQEDAVTAKAAIEELRKTSNEGMSYVLRVQAEKNVFYVQTQGIRQHANVQAILFHKGSDTPLAGMVLDEADTEANPTLAFDYSAVSAGDYTISLWVDETGAFEYREGRVPREDGQVIQPSGMLELTLVETGTEGTKSYRMASDAEEQKTETPGSGSAAEEGDKSAEPVDKVAGAEGSGAGAEGSGAGAEEKSAGTEGSEAGAEGSGAGAEEKSSVSEGSAAGAGDNSFETENGLADRNGSLATIPKVSTWAAVEYGTWTPVYVMPGNSGTTRIDAGTKAQDKAQETAGDSEKIREDGTKTSMIIQQDGTITEVTTFPQGDTEVVINRTDGSKEEYLVLNGGNVRTAVRIRTKPDGTKTVRAFVWNMAEGVTFLFGRDRDDGTLKLLRADLGDAVSVTIPSEVRTGSRFFTVTSIAPYACVSNSAVEKVIIGRSIKVIGTAAFAGCENLTEVVCNGSVLIGREAFFQCGQLKALTFKGNVGRAGKDACKGINRNVTVTIKNISKVQYQKILQRIQASGVPENASYLRK